MRRRRARGKPGSPTTFADSILPARHPILRCFSCLPFPAPVSAACLWHHNDVARLEQEVLQLSVRRDDLVIVKRDPLQGVPIWPENDDSSAGGELTEPFGQRQGIQHRGSALQLMAPWLFDFPDYGDLEAVHFPDDHR